MAGKRLAGWTITLGCVVGLLAGNAAAELPQFVQPGWTALTPEQQNILAPLRKEWGEMDAFRRKKWLGIAQRYPDMSPAEQYTMQNNMREWARLAPEERKIAREKYKSLRKIAPEKREVVKQKWEEYSTLTEEEKDRYRKKAPVQKKLKTPNKPPVATQPDEKRVATPTVPPPRSPISPRKPPQSPLAPKSPPPGNTSPAFPHNDLYRG